MLYTCHVIYYIIRQHVIILNALPIPYTKVGVPIARVTHRAHSKSITARNQLKPNGNFDPQLSIHDHKDIDDWSSRRAVSGANSKSPFQKKNRSISSTYPGFKRWFHLVVSVATRWHDCGRIFGTWCILKNNQPRSINLIYKHFKSNLGMGKISLYIITVAYVCL